MTTDNNHKGGNPVWRLLRHNVSMPQLAGYAVANLLGLAILLTALQFYRDVSSARENDDTLISRDYIILSKKVKGGLTALFSGADATVFTPSDIADIEAQPWAVKTGAFTASDFNVAASVDFGGRSMSTYLFFESIPDEFFDISPQGWKFDPSTDTTVPIILSKDYLTLYNFGFAASRGLPQLSESTISMIPLRVSISGRGRQQWLPARIVGFSSRLNTIAVPEDFMKWANDNYADNPSPGPSRLIVEASSPGDPAIDSYLAAKGYERAGDKAAGGRAAFLLKVSTGVVVAIGAIISALSFFILLLSIWLLLQKNRDKIHQLLLLGYSPSDISRYYYAIVAGVNAVVAVGAIACVAVARHMWRTPLESLGAGGASLTVTIIVGVALIAVITLLNFASIRHTVSRAGSASRAR